MIAALKIWLSGQYLTSIICAAIYWHFSGQIFQDSYKKVSLNTVIINLSVIFGIYQYGVSGIFYGPLLILLFQCVRLELFQIKNHWWYVVNSQNYTYSYQMATAKITTISTTTITKPTPILNLLEDHHIFLFNFTALSFMSRDSFAKVLLFSTLI